MHACGDRHPPGPRAGRARGTLPGGSFFRLNVVAITLPPLRERAADLAALIESRPRRHRLLAPSSATPDRALSVEPLERRHTEQVLADAAMLEEPTAASAST